LCKAYLIKSSNMYPPMNHNNTPNNKCHFLKTSKAIYKMKFVSSKKKKNINKSKTKMNKKMKMKMKTKKFYKIW